MTGGLGGAGIQRGEFRLGVDSFKCILGDLPHPKGIGEPLKVSESSMGQDMGLLLQPQCLSGAFGCSRSSLIMN